MPTETDAAASPGGATLQRIAIGVEYDGSPYAGWQQQSHAPSIQATLERAIAAVADHPVRTAAAGRTDAGVHAWGQVVHFDTKARRASHSWTLGINSHLPPAVAVLWARSVTTDFHARYSALGRTYRYLILNRPVRPALERYRVWWFRRPLDEARMHDAAQQLVGEHDFSAFRGAACQSRSPVRRLDRVRVERQHDYLLVSCEGSGFLQHMVRIIVGCLVRVGSGDAPPEWLRSVLAGRDRRRAAATAPPAGLYLAQVTYPEAWGLPHPPARQFWRDH